MTPQGKPKTSPEVYAYIDSQNLNVTTQKDGWKMNWARFRQWLADEYGVTKAYMFIGYVPEFEAMYEQLHDQGYAIVLKPTFDMTRVQEEENREGEPEREKKPVKGNIDAELVLWAMKDFKAYDKAIVVSGDGDFYCLVEYLDEQGKLLKLLRRPANIPACTTSTSSMSNGWTTTNTSFSTATGGASQVASKLLQL
jgi:hypothetical protein